MRVRELVERLSLHVYTDGEALDAEIRLGYVSDLMSDVIAHAEENDLWITVQVHVNIVGVAAMKDMSAVVIAGGRRPADATVEKAAREKVVVLGSDLPAFELAGRVYELGIRGV